ncbi:MAG: hypothetical protein HY558_05290 [Euryarchaeota archaeon]|nr:hypothetical protein [Euryarchaeota archaeon]
MDDILQHLKIGPKTADELAKLVAVSRKTLYKRMGDLVESQKVLIFPLLMENHWVSLYALPEHRDLAVAISGYIPAGRVTAGIEPRVAEALDRLKFKLCRNPDVDEVALEVGENPEDRAVRDAIYRVASKLNWRPPTAEDRRRAEKERSLVVELATWMKKGYLEATKDKPQALVQKAKEYLRRFPESLPDR